MPLSKYLNDKGFTTLPLHLQNTPEQADDIVALTAKPNINVVEIGFNSGHSAEVILQNNKSATLTSFDISTEPYISDAKEYIDKVYQNRHILVMGDTSETIPKYSEHIGVKFDIICIHCGNSYEKLSIDLKNCEQLATADNILVLTNITSDSDLSIWKEYVSSGKIIQLYQKPCMIWGKYTLCA